MCCLDFEGLRKKLPKKATDDTGQWSSRFSGLRPVCGRYRKADTVVMRSLAAARIRRARARNDDNDREKGRRTCARRRSPRGTSRASSLRVAANRSFFCARPAFSCNHLRRCSRSVFPPPPKRTSTRSGGLRAATGNRRYELHPIRTRTRRQEMIKQ